MTAFQVSHLRLWRSTRHAHPVDNTPNRILFSEWEDIPHGSPLSWAPPPPPPLSPPPTTKHTRTDRPSVPLLVPRLPPDTATPLSLSDLCKRWHPPLTRHIAMGALPCGELDRLPMEWAQLMARWILPANRLPQVLAFLSYPALPPGPFRTPHRSEALSTRLSAQQPSGCLTPLAAETTKDFMLRSLLYRSSMATW